MASTRIATSLHNVASIEVDTPEALDSGSFVRTIYIITEDGTRYEVTVFSKNKESIEMSM